MIGASDRETFQVLAGLACVCHICTRKHDQVMKYVYERNLQVQHACTTCICKAPLYVIRSRFESGSSFISATQRHLPSRRRSNFWAEQHAAVAAKRQTGVGSGHWAAELAWPWPQNKVSETKQANGQM